MLGLPKIHTWKLPSRNWCIFWSVLGSFGGTVAYDRYQKKQIITRYRDMVSHLADEPLQPLQMPRKMRIFLGAPPGDTIHVARVHFQEYVKPILNAAAIDFELLEGKMQGDIRHTVAQAIRDKRRGIDGMTELTRLAMDKLDYDQTGGDIVIGRHTFKEYVRGIHEGVLGPLEEPESVTAIMHPRMPGDPVIDEGTAVEDTTQTDEERQKEIDEIKKKIPTSPPSYISTSEYSSLTPNDPQPITYTFVPLQHLLGFLNTPWRIYRFLNRRILADEVCKNTVSAVLASSRPLIETDLQAGVSEELDWPKKNRTKEDGVWVEPIVTDKRVLEHVNVYT